MTHNADTVLARDAEISSCGSYRYELRRHLGGSGILVWVMLNPSTADHAVDDPTIRRVMAFTRREDLGLAIVVNLFALRSPSPKALRGHEDPIGPLNDHYLKHWGDIGWPIVCAWGAGGGRRADEVLSGPLAGANLWCLGTTKDGSPRHPLYVRGDQPLVRFGRTQSDGEA